MKSNKRDKSAWKKTFFMNWHFPAGLFRQLHIDNCQCVTSALISSFRQGLGSLWMQNKLKLQRCYRFYLPDNMLLSRVMQTLVTKHKAVISPSWRDMVLCILSPLCMDSMDCGLQERCSGPQFPTVTINVLPPVILRICSFSLILKV